MTVANGFPDDVSRLLNILASEVFLDGPKEMFNHHDRGSFSLLFFIEEVIVGQMDFSVEFPKTELLGRKSAICCVILEGSDFVIMAEYQNPLPDIELPSRVECNTIQKIGIHDVFLDDFVLEFFLVFELSPVIGDPIAEL